MPASSELTEMWARRNSERVDEGQGQMFIRRQSSQDARQCGEDAEEVGDMTASSELRVLESDGEDSRYWWAEEEYYHTNWQRVIPRCEWRRHGWYHVHDDRATCRFCSAYSGCHLSDAPERALSFRAFQSAISRFPPEVIHRIVELCPEAGYGPSWSPGMVCRHWANVCLRPPMSSYRSGNRLKGREHIMTLKALVSAPGSYLKHNVTEFIYKTYDLDENTEARWEQKTRWELTHSQSRRSDRAPWLHLLPATRRLLPNYDAKDMVSIRGPLPDDVRTMRSIHVYLPRPMPPSFSHGIQSLTLQDIQFRQLADLQHVLDELPSLSEFEGMDLFWPPVDAVQMTRVPRHMKGGFMYKYLSLVDCTNDLEAITLFASLHDDRTWATPLRTFAQSLGPSLSAVYDMRVYMDEACEYYAERFLFHDHKFHVDAAHTAYRIAKAEIDIAKGPRYDDPEYTIFACVPLPTSLPPSNPRLHLEPAIYLDPTYVQDEFNWKTFDETFLHMTQLLGTCGVRVRGWAQESRRVGSFEKGWRTLADSEDDQGWQFIKEHLPLLYQAGKIEVQGDDPCDPESSGHGSDDEDQESEGEESDPLHHVEPAVVLES